MFTLRDMKMVVGISDLVPSDDDPSVLVPVSEYYSMTAEEIAGANLELIREKRDALLAETDWVSGEDVPQTIKDAWFPYRQALRDITQTYSVYDEVVWPTKPA